MKKIATFFLLSFLWLYSSCDFQNPAGFTVPSWNVNLVFPLIAEKYPLGNIVNDSTIHSGGDSIFIQFEGTLPADSVNEDYLKIPLDISTESSSTVTPPNASDYFDSASVTISLTVPIGETMDGTVINIAADPPTTVQIPSSEEQQITGESWNLIASTIESALGDSSIILPLLDFDEVFGEIPFIESVQGIVIGGSDTSNFFQSSTENVDLPLNVDSSWTDLITGVRYLAQHDTSDLQSGDIFEKMTSLVGDTLGEAVEIRFGFTLERAEDEDTVTIAPNTDLEIEIEVSLEITNLEKAIVTISEYSLAPTLDPISFSDASVSAEDCAVRGIYGGVFDTPTSSGINTIGISNVSSTYPFDIDFGIDFANFVSPVSDTLQFGDVLRRGESPLDQSEKLDGWTFINPVDPDSALEELIVEVSANTVADTVNIFLDGTEPDWTFSLGVDVYPLYFVTLEADLNCPFPTQSQEISGVPQGFTGMNFGEVILQFTMYNQIRLPLFLDLDLVGVSNMGDSVRVLLYAPLGTPETVVDTAKTTLELSSLGTKVEIFDSVSDSVADSSYTVSAGPGVNTIVDLLRLNPSEIVVDATAGIQGRGAIDVGAAIWGDYKLIAPFKVQVDTMIFIPVSSTPLAEMPNETRNQLRSSVRGGGMTTRVINSLPIGGELAILFSDRDLFPLDRTTETLAMVRDSLGWPLTDSLYVVTSCDSLTPSNSDMFIFSVFSDSTECIDDVAYLVRGVTGVTDTVYSFVDTLFKIVLPLPPVLYSIDDTTGIPGMTKIPGDTTVTSEIDTNTIALLTALGDHYINIRTQFNGSESVVFFSMKDTLEIQSFMSFIMKSTGLLEEAEDEIVIEYPNGGETLTVGEETIIRWRSLGKEISNSKIEVFKSKSGSPDVGEESDWSSISNGAIANVDSMLWTPSATSDSLWLRICDENGSICDKSGWFFTVTSGSNVLVSGSGSNQPRLNKNSRKGKSRGLNK